MAPTVGKIVAQIPDYEDVRVTSRPVQTFYARIGKRWLDVAFAGGGLFALLPLWVVVSLLVKLTSPGPVFYRQNRVGLGGRIFHIAKFRSMYIDADQHGLPVTAAGDRRVTPVGRVLRCLKIDELPQLWNVLVGDMSLVGPRPEVPQYVEGYSAVQRRVLSIRPGITDPTSILYREEEKILGAQSDPERYYREVVLPHKLELNGEYAECISFAYDLLLIVRTFECLVRPLWQRHSKTQPAATLISCHSAVRKTQKRSPE